MKKITFIKDYLVYKKGTELSTTIYNGEKLISKGLAEWSEEEKKEEKPKRKRRTKEEMKQAMENKSA